MIKLLKNKEFSVVFIFLSTAVLSCVMAQAQTNTLSVEAKIPFEFTAGSAQFPAGTYIFVPAKGVTPSLDVQSPKKDTHEMVTAESTKQNMGQPMKPQLVFERVGSKEFLRQVWIEQKDYMIGKSSNETSMEKQGLKSESHRINCRYTQGEVEKTVA